MGRAAERAPPGTGVHRERLCVSPFTDLGTLHFRRTTAIIIKTQQQRQRRWAAAANRKKEEKRERKYVLDCLVWVCFRCSFASNTHHTQHTTPVGAVAPVGALYRNRTTT